MISCGITHQLEPAAGAKERSRVILNALLLRPRAVIGEIDCFLD